MLEKIHVTREYPYHELSSFLVERYLERSARMWQWTYGNQFLWRYKSPDHYGY